MPKLARRGFLLIALPICVALLIALAAPTLLRRRMAAGEITAPQDLCNIDRAVKAYVAEHGTTPPSLSSLRGHILPVLSCDAPACEYHRYRFRYNAAQGSGKPRYSISAQPLSRTGISFYVDDSGVLRYTVENREATNSDPSADTLARPCNE